MINFDCSEGGFNSLVYVETLLINEVIKAMTVEFSLDFREDRFYRIEFRRVTDVPNRFHV